MKALTMEEVNDVSGGIPWSTPAAVAIADTGSLGPLTWAFGVGYGIGTLISNAYSTQINDAVSSFFSSSDSFGSSF